jgi:hypothetical protein
VGSVSSAGESYQPALKTPRIRGRSSRQEQQAGAAIIDQLSFDIGHLSFRDETLSATFLK